MFAKLLDLGWAESEVAKKAGVSRQYVSDLLALRAAPREVVSLVETGQVSATLARATMKTSGEDAGEVLGKAVETARAAGKSRATAKHVERKPRPEVVSVPRNHPTFVAGVRFAIEKAREMIGKGQGDLAGFAEALEAEIAE